MVSSTKSPPAIWQRNAYLYVRQSTLRQVLENTESTQRQYALRQQAIRLGWPLERVIVIDCDQGQSGSSAADREGFQQLVTEVSLGRAGIVLGLEVSRLARNSTDWHRLLEICALTDTLILDEDGVYDPKHFNDRLLLGMKGALSEAELHVLHARLQGGIVSKARRGEFRKPLPTGLVYNEQGKVILDPDRQTRQTLTTFFRTFERLGSAMATVHFFQNKKLLFPRRLRRDLAVVWATLTHSLALSLLAQSPLCRLLRAWPNPLAPDSEREIENGPGGSRRMGRRTAGSAPGLHYLGTIPTQSPDLAEEFASPWPRTPSAAAGRSCPSARARRSAASAANA